MSQQATNQHTIREFTRIFKNEHNVDGVGHLFDPQFVHHFRTPMPTGLEGLMELLQQAGVLLQIG